MRVRVGRIDIDVVLRDPLLADQRLGQPVRVVRVIEAEAALDAEPVVVGRPVLALDRDDAVVADLVGQLTADPAIGADAVDLAVGRVGIDAVRIDQARRHQRAGRAGLHAFAAGDAGAVAHRVVEIEDDLLVVAARRHADHVVDLDFAAGADAEIALDAGVELHRHRRMAAVGRRRRVPREAAVADAELVGPLPEARIGVVRRRPRGLVARPAARRPSCARTGRARSRSEPSCRRPACARRRRRAPARPRFRPCRRGNCRRRGSRVSAASRGAGSRCPAGRQPARSSRPVRPTPRSRRGRSGSVRSSGVSRNERHPGESRGPGFNRF